MTHLIDRLRQLAVLIVVASCFSTSCLAERPNIVLIMCDDMGWSDIGCYGGEVETPHLDRMAAEGMRFTQFYNCAKCTTTRASIVTGLHPRRKGGLLTRKMVTTGEVLAAAGYQDIPVRKMAPRSQRRYASL